MKKTRGQKKFLTRFSRETRKKRKKSHISTARSLLWNFFGLILGQFEKLLRKIEIKSDFFKKSGLKKFSQFFSHEIRKKRKKLQILTARSPFMKFVCSYFGKF